MKYTKNAKYSINNIIEMKYSIFILQNENVYMIMVSFDWTTQVWPKWTIPED